MVIKNHLKQLFAVILHIKNNELKLIQFQNVKMQIIL